MGKVLSWMLRNCSDEVFLKVYWLKKKRFPLHLENPRSFNEKIQWLKAYYHDPMMTVATDKYSAKDYAGSRIGTEHIIPTLGVWNEPEDIDFDSLPEKFVLKTTNGANNKGVVICRDKSSFDKDKAIKRLRKDLHYSQYKLFREWSYKDIHPRIIAEEFITDDTAAWNLGLTDYKFFCFNGKVEYILCCTDRCTKVKYYFMNRDWELQKITKFMCSLKGCIPVTKPGCIDEMIRISEALAKDFPEVRVDLYYAQGQIWFGEMTFYPGSGFKKNRSWESDLEWGSKLQLPSKRL